MVKRRQTLGFLGGLTLAGLTAQCRHPVAQSSNLQPVAQAFPDAEFLGLNIGTELNWTNWRDKLLPLYQAAGVKWLRVWYNWATLEPERGRYDSELTLQSLRMAKDMGFKILFVVWGTPAYAGNGELGSVPELGAFTQYCNWLKTNLGDVVSAWEIGNEPNLSQYFDGSPKQYIQTLSAAYRVFQGHGLVIGAGSSGQASASYWQALIDNGLQQCCDRVNLHPYRVRSDEVIRVVDRFLEKVNKPVWITEIGRKTDDGGEQLKANFVSNLLPQLTNRVEKVFWYRSIQGENMHPMRYGLIEVRKDRDDVVPLPAYQAFANFSSSLAERTIQANRLGFPPS